MNILSGRSRRVLLAANVLLVFPAVILYYATDASGATTTSSSVQNIFAALAVPATVTAVFDVYFLLAYARAQPEVASKTAQSPARQDLGRRIVQSGLFWFNVLALLPCILILLNLAFRGGQDLNIGMGLMLIFLAPVALTTALLDVYYVYKWLSAK